MTRHDFIISQLPKEIRDFSGADLHGLDFSGLELEGLNFEGANLSGCIFWCTRLISCNFENADLSGIKMGCRTLLYNVNLTNANLDNARFSFDKCLFDEVKIDVNTMDKYFPSICPSEGEFVGWKKAYSQDNEVIVKLLIPKDARRGSAFRRKCRCDKAKVLDIEQLHRPSTPGSIFGDSPYGSGIVCARSIYDRQFEYEIGKEVSVDNFDEDRSHECAPGIHFFMTREEAVNY